jgi:hypothetical protein
MASVLEEPNKRGFWGALGNHFLGFDKREKLRLENEQRRRSMAATERLPEQIAAMTGPMTGENSVLSPEYSQGARNQQRADVVGSMAAIAPKTTANSVLGSMYPSPQQTNRMQQQLGLMDALGYPRNPQGFAAYNQDQARPPTPAEEALADINLDRAREQAESLRLENQNAREARRQRLATSETAQRGIAAQATDMVDLIIKLDSGKPITNRMGGPKDGAIGMVQEGIASLASPIFPGVRKREAQLEMVDKIGQFMADKLDDAKAAANNATTVTKFNNLKESLPNSEMEPQAALMALKDVLKGFVGESSGLPEAAIDQASIEAMTVLAKEIPTIVDKINGDTLVFKNADEAQKFADKYSGLMRPGDIVYIGGKELVFSDE